MKNRLKKPLLTLLLGALCHFPVLSYASQNSAIGPQLNSMTALTFSPEGVLFIGDAHQGIVVAIDLTQSKTSTIKTPPSITDLEGQVAALVGAKASDILIHDMAVNPVSKKVYLSVNRGRTRPNYSFYGTRYTPKNPSMLIRVNGDSTIELVDLSDMKYTTATLPNPIDSKRNYTYGDKSSMRANAITQMAYREGTLYVAGMSNEEFTSSLWTFPYPFGPKVTATTVEIFHGAHGQNETHAPIRAFLPYTLNKKGHLLAAYLCTPLVTIELDKLQDKKHVKGNTIAELGAGNIPIDMITFSSEGTQKIMISNTELPLLTINAVDINRFKGIINTRVNTFSSGVDYHAESASGVQQLDNFSEDYVIATKRGVSGQLSLMSYAKNRF